MDRVEACGGLFLLLFFFVGGELTKKNSIFFFFVFITSWVPERQIREQSRVVISETYPLAFE